MFNAPMSFTLLILFNKPYAAGWSESCFNILRVWSTATRSAYEDWIALYNDSHRVSQAYFNFLSSSFLTFRYLAGDFSVAVTDCFFSCCYWVTSKSLWRVFKGASTVLLPLFLPFWWTSNLLHLWHQCMPKLNCGIYSELKRGFASFSFTARPFFLPTMTEAPSVANPINLTIERVRACN